MIDLLVRDSKFSPPAPSSALGVPHDAGAPALRHVGVSAERQIANSGIYLVPTMVGSILPLVTLPIFTRILTKEDYGAWALANVYAVFVTGLANFGLTIGYERNFFEHRRPKEAAELLYSVVAAVASAFVLAGVGTWLFRVRLAGWIIGTPEQSTLLFWAFCAAGMSSLKAYFLIYFRNSADARSYVWYTVDETILGTVFSLILVAGIRLGVLGLILGQLLASLIIVTLLAVRFVRRLPPAFSGRLLADALKISYPLTPRIFLGVVSNNFDKYLIGLLSTVGGVGVYTIGQRVANMVFAYMTALENVYTPQVYERMFHHGEAVRREVGQYLTPFAYASVAIAFLVALFSEEALLVLTPPAYHGAVPIANILSLSYAILFFNKPPQLTFAKKTHVTSMLTLLTLGLNVGINLIFVPRWGAVGAAWGTLVAGLLSGAAAFAARQYYYRIDWEYGRVFAIFGLLFFAALVTAALREAGVVYGIRLVMKGGLLVAFTGLGLKLGFLSAENWRLVRGMVTQRLSRQQMEA